MMHKQLYFQPFIQKTTHLLLNKMKRHLLKIKFLDQVCPYNQDWENEALPYLSSYVNLANMNTVEPS